MGMLRLVQATMVAEATARIIRRRPGSKHTPYFSVIAYLAPLSESFQVPNEFANLVLDRTHFSFLIFSLHIQCFAPAY